MSINAAYVELKNPRPFVTVRNMPVSAARGCQPSVQHSSRWITNSLLAGTAHSTCASGYHADLKTVSSNRTPSVVAEWLTLLLRIRKALDSNLGPETSYCDWESSWFSSASSGKCRKSTLKLGHDRFLPHDFQLIIHLSHLRSTTNRLSHWKTVVK
jgi:hypothetical protein